MDHDRLWMATALLASFGMATVIDNIDDLGLGDNPVFPAVWKSNKKLDTGLAVQNNTLRAKRVIRSGFSMTVIRPDMLKLLLRIIS